MTHNLLSFQPDHAGRLVYVCKTDGERFIKSARMVCLIQVQILCWGRVDLLVDPSCAPISIVYSKARLYKTVNWSTIPS